jgi:murein DD-endopeptidase MepM/ murein hydrolase activator NlpD
MAILTGSARSKLVIVVLAALSLSACAGTRTANKAPARGSYFTAPVFPGDSPAAFAERYGVQAAEIVALNNIKDPNRRLSRGQLRVPAYGRQREERTLKAVVQSAVMTGTRASTVQGRPASIETRSLAPLSAPSARNASVKANGLDAPQTASAPTVVASRTQPSAAEATWYDWLMPSAPPAADAAVDPHFLWPVEGRVISPFGNNPNGGRNDGINISATRGAPVRAAEAGDVSYVGNELKSYGNLILIRHDNGFVTAYAHTDGVHVKRGERVERGQVIGSAGNTGDVSEVQLHFELRRGTTPVDPTPYLVAPVPEHDSTERLAEGPR